MIGAAIIGSVLIIVIVEILRSFRLLHRSVEDIDELKEKVANIEKLLKK